jgi:hypothetical protein
VIETFDNLTYNVLIGKGTNDDAYAIRVTLSGEPPKARTPGKDEKKEDQEKLDKEFKDKLDKLTTRLKREKSFEKWTFQVSKYTIDVFLKNRSEFIKPPPPPPSKDEAKPATGTALESEIKDGVPDINSIIPDPLAPPK